MEETSSLRRSSKVRRSSRGALRRSSSRPPLQVSRPSLPPGWMPLCEDEDSIFGSSPRDASAHRSVPQERLRPILNSDSLSVPRPANVSTNYRAQVPDPRMSPLLSTKEVFEGQSQLPAIPYRSGSGSGSRHELVLNSSPRNPPSPVLSTNKAKLYRMEGSCGSGPQAQATLDSPLLKSSIPATSRKKEGIRGKALRKGNASSSAPARLKLPSTKGKASRSIRKAHHVALQKAACPIGFSNSAPKTSRKLPRSVVTRTELSSNDLKKFDLGKRGILDRRVISKANIPCGDAVFDSLPIVHPTQRPRHPLWQGQERSDMCKVRRRIFEMCVRGSLGTLISLARDWSCDDLPSSNGTEEFESEHILPFKMVIKLCGLEGAFRTPVLMSELMTYFLTHSDFHLLIRPDTESWHSLSTQMWPTNRQMQRIQSLTIELNMTTHVVKGKGTIHPASKMEQVVFDVVDAIKSRVYTIRGDDGFWKQHSSIQKLNIIRDRTSFDHRQSGGHDKTPRVPESTPAPRYMLPDEAFYFCDHLVNLRGRIGEMRIAGFGYAYAEDLLAGIFGECYLSTVRVSDPQGKLPLEEVFENQQKDNARPVNTNALFTWESRDAKTEAGGIMLDSVGRCRDEQRLQTMARLPGSTFPISTFATEGTPITAQNDLGGASSYTGKPTKDELLNEVSSITEEISAKIPSITIGSYSQETDAALELASLFKFQQPDEVLSDNASIITIIPRPSSPLSPLPLQSPPPQTTRKLSFSELDKINAANSADCRFLSKLTNSSESAERPASDPVPAVKSEVEHDGGQKRETMPEIGGSLRGFVKSWTLRGKKSKSG